MYLFDLAGDIDFVSHYKLVENHKIDGYAKAFVVEDGDWDTVLTYKVRLYVTSRTKDQTSLKRVGLITGISRTDPSSLVIEYLLWRFLQLVLKKMTTIELHGRIAELEFHVSVVRINLT